MYDRAETAYHDLLAEPPAAPAIIPDMPRPAPAPCPECAAPAGSPCQPWCPGARNGA